MAETTTSPKAADLLSVRSRVSWGAIAAGAMVALAVYFFLTLLGVAVGIEAVARGRDSNLGIGAALYAILSLLVSMFFGGWTVSRLAVGETKLEAVLYGIILWGVLFTGMLWLVGNGVRVGFVALVGTASGAYTNEKGEVDYARLGEALKQAGVDQATTDKAVSEIRRVQSDPNALPGVARENIGPAAATRVARSAAWYALLGVVVSMSSVILGSLIGSGEVPVPVPILGVRRPIQAPRQ
jgi:hypothetical protein